jgi:hypothetical protein
VSWSLWETQTDAERRHRLTPEPPKPDGGFAKAAYRWASLVELDDLEYGSLAAGDFVRVSRQLVDLLQQIRDAFPELAEDARAPCGSWIAGWWRHRGRVMKWLVLVNPRAGRGLSIGQCAPRRAAVPAWTPGRAAGESPRRCARWRWRGQSTTTSPSSVATEPCRSSSTRS